MRRICLDADAAHCLRKLSAGSASLLDMLAAVSSRSGMLLIMTEYVARHELNSIAGEIERLESQGALEIKAVLRSDATFRGLIKSGLHKGEAEAIAWILSLTKVLRPLFVSLDEGAIRTASARGLAATDVMGLLVDAIESGIVSAEQARSALIIWDDRRQQIGRPSDYQGFDNTLARRRKRPPDYYK